MMAVGVCANSGSGAWLAPIVTDAETGVSGDSIMLGANGVSWLKRR